MALKTRLEELIPHELGARKKKVESELLMHKETIKELESNITDNTKRSKEISELAKSLVASFNAELEKLRHGSEIASQMAKKEEEMQKLNEVLDEVVKNKKILEGELSEMRKGMLGQACEEKTEEGTIHLIAENRYYKFVLKDVYRGHSRYIQFSYPVDDITQHIILEPKKDCVLKVVVDSQEIAEDISNRIEWASEWIVGSADSKNLDVTLFETKNGQKTDIGSAEVVVDTGFVEFGALEPDIKEYYISGSKFKGTLVLENVESKDLASGSNERKMICSFYPIPDSPIPYVLSQKAVNEKWLPEDPTRSGLPRRIRKHVPIRHRYWKQPSDKEGVRDNLVELINTDRMFLPIKGEHNGQFTLLKEWVPNVELKYHLLINDSKFFTHLDITEPVDNFQMTESDSFGLDIGKNGEEKISDEPRYVVAIDWGSCAIYENLDNRKSVQFNGAKLKGEWSFDRVEGGTWAVELKEPPKDNGIGLDNSQIDKIIEMSRANKDRPEICDAVNCGKRTVLKYQKNLGFI